MGTFAIDPVSIEEALVVCYFRFGIKVCDRTFQIAWKVFFTLIALGIALGLTIDYRLAIVTFLLAGLTFLFNFYFMNRHLKTVPSAEGMSQLAANLAQARVGFGGEQWRDVIVLNQAIQKGDPQGIRQSYDKLVSLPDLDADYYRYLELIRWTFLYK